MDVHEGIKKMIVIKLSERLLIILIAHPPHSDQPTVTGTIEAILASCITQKYSLYVLITWSSVHSVDIFLNCSLFSENLFFS